MSASATTEALPTRRVPRINVLSAIGLLFVAVVLFWLGVNLAKEPAAFASTFLDGLTLGLVYGLVALGYSLVYGILELINFAHGDVFMLGSAISFGVATNWFSLHDTNSMVKLVPALLGTLAIATIICATLNASIEFVAYRPLRSAPRLAPLITAIGMSFFLQNVGLYFLGPAPVSVPNILSHNAVFTIGGHEDRWDQLIVGPSTPPAPGGLVYLLPP